MGLPPIAEGSGAAARAGGPGSCQDSFERDENGLTPLRVGGASRGVQQ
jgi:hypothetical protein